MSGMARKATIIYRSHITQKILKRHGYLYASGVLVLDPIRHIRLRIDRAASMTFIQVSTGEEGKFHETALGPLLEIANGWDA